MYCSKSLWQGWLWISEWTGWIKKQTNKKKKITFTPLGQWLLCLHYSLQFNPQKDNDSKHFLSVFMLTYLKLWPNVEAYSVFLVCKGDMHAFMWVYAHTNVWHQGEDERLEGTVAHMFVKIEPVPAPLQISRLTEANTSTWCLVQPVNIRQVNRTKSEN